MASVLASTEISLLRNPNLHNISHPHKTSVSSNNVRFLSNLSFPKPKQLHNPFQPIPKFRVSAIDQSYNKNPSFPNLLSDSTRSIASIISIALSLSKLFSYVIQRVSFKMKGIYLNPNPEELLQIQTLQETLVCTMGPLFFAAIRDRPNAYMNTPLTVVASGMAKWLDIYSGVLMVRVLLSWFPNIPWDLQPLSAIRDLCDPYLNLFRNIIPPIFDTLDVSPLLAFAVLGTLGTILNIGMGGAI